MNKALKIYFKLNLGLNIPTKTLIDSCVVFFRLLGPSEASVYEITKTPHISRLTFHLTLLGYSDRDVI